MTCQKDCLHDNSRAATPTCEYAKTARLKVYALATGEKRIGEVQSSVAEGKLTFTADVSENAAETGARMLYEIAE